MDPSIQLISNLCKNLLVFIPDDEAKLLIKEYFFDKFTDDEPSGYLWTYYKALLGVAVKNFSTSYFLGKTFLEDTDADIKRINKLLYDKLKLKDTFRLEFLKVLVSNCFEFTQRSVKPGNENSASALQETLREMPFLIIPNSNDDSFSFVYNNSENVPYIIKVMIVLQEPSVF